MNCNICKDIDSLKLGFFVSATEGNKATELDL